MKPELLLPAGSIEAFFAAIEGGADAIYLGLNHFNARGRASNFNLSQLEQLCFHAKKNNVKIYLTLNTVIKNEELPELLDTLFVLSKSKISAVIIQDWGIYYLIKKHFPQIKVHASTQMANHNSAGAIFSEKHGFERIILARELMLNELQEIKRKSNIQLEVFIHGALCYSFSGMCLFSSYIGGQGANRGLCKQPCRRYYESEKKNDIIFSLKDQQLLKYIPELTKTGITSFKIEGRMKSAEYVYRVAKAYRMLIDNPEKINEAAEILEMDLSREKTSFFVGRDIGNAITSNPSTGKLLGKIISSSKDSFIFSSEIELNQGNRIRIHSKKGEIRGAVKLKKFESGKNNKIIVWQTNHNAITGDLVFLSELRNKKFNIKFDEKPGAYIQIMPAYQKSKILKQLKNNNNKGRQETFVRIDSLKWLNKIWIKNIDRVILNLPKREWSELKSDSPFIQKNSGKFIIELPKFITESNLNFYKELCLKLSVDKLKTFMISHISQKEILPKNTQTFTNENVYIFNDAAIAFLQSEHINTYIYPLENEIINLYKSSDRNGIVPLYFHPQLFLSRVPIKTGGNIIVDDREEKFQRDVRDGLTVITPERSVSLLQYKNELQKNGFHKWLIDLSSLKPSKNIFNTIMKKFMNSEQIQPSITFNFKKGLK